MSKSRSSLQPRAFLVLAPASHGSHLVTDILIHAGCHGGSGGRDDSARDRSVQPWDKAPPSGQDPIVWRRSIPHGGRWPDIELMVRSLRQAGYAVSATVVTRDRWAALQSQLERRHVDDLETGKKNIERAYEHIFFHVQKAGLDAHVVSYESLVHYPAAQDFLLEELGLEPPKERFPVWDGNEKWYSPENVAHRARKFEARAEIVIDDLR